MDSKIISQKNIYTITPGRPFLDTLASGIIFRTKQLSIPLSSCSVFLPTRRAVASLRNSFLKANKGEAIVLPEIFPIGDLDVDEMLLSRWQSSKIPEFEDPPPPIPDMKRRLILTRLIQAYTNDGSHIEQSARLAGTLSQLLDNVQTQGITFSGLDDLVPEEYSAHWQTTLKFLKILTQQWPKILKENNWLDPADRRNLLIQNRIKLWKKISPNGLIFAAGSTGSIPATANLLHFIACQKYGYVVLPGLDVTLDQNGGGILEASHPQFALGQLLSTMNVHFGEVKNWESQVEKNGAIDRHLIINTALNPVGHNHSLKTLQQIIPHAMKNVEFIECATAEEESGIIALMMRKTLDEPDKTAALITLDRNLARRVSIQLSRWNIMINDSAGQPLADTQPGIFLRLTAQLIKSQFKPLDLLALCKHPLAAFGLAPFDLKSIITELEMVALRGPRPAPGIDGLLAITPSKNSRLIQFLIELSEASKDFSKLINKNKSPIGRIVAAHISFSEMLARSDTRTGEELLWKNDAGKAAAEFLHEVMKNCDMEDIVPGHEYPRFLDTLMSDQVVRSKMETHPRLQIWGPLEARLQFADLMILGGLNEGTWPPDTKADPWMSRPMRRKFGLSLQEKRIGLSAHDFAQYFCAPNVALTRSRQVDGQPQLVTRWVLQILRLLKSMELEKCIEPKFPWAQWYYQMDKPDSILPIKPPAPCPPTPSRPRKLSATQIETLMRDPYSIYAKHILNLEPLPNLDTAPESADYGVLIHQILNTFIKECSSNNLVVFDKTSRDLLLEIGKTYFETLKGYPSVLAFWWPRFVRITHWFVERDLRNNLSQMHTEIKGEAIIVNHPEQFTLSATADRIDILSNGKIRIIDYKTGVLPPINEIHAGFSPQLPLIGIIASLGGFDGVPYSGLESLEFWRLNGGWPAGEIKSVDEDPENLVKETLKGLKRLIKFFDSELTPYSARPRPDQAPRYSAYEHLARIKEWDTVAPNARERRT